MRKFLFPGIHGPDGELCIGPYHCPFISTEGGKLPATVQFRTHFPQVSYKTNTVEYSTWTHDKATAPARQISGYTGKRNLSS